METRTHSRPALVRTLAVPVQCVHCKSLLVSTPHVQTFAHDSALSPTTILSTTSPSPPSTQSYLRIRKTSARFRACRTIDVSAQAIKPFGLPTCFSSPLLSPQDVRSKYADGLWFLRFRGSLAIRALCTFLSTFHALSNFYFLFPFTTPRRALYPIAFFLPSPARLPPFPSPVSLSSRSLPPFSLPFPA